jgi:hypothetical protein
MEITMPNKKDKSSHGHNHGGCPECDNHSQVETVRFVIHPKEKGKIYDMPMGESTMNNIIAALCNDGFLTIYTLDADGNELTKSLSEAENAEKKKSVIEEAKEVLKKKTEKEEN